MLILNRHVHALFEEMFPHEEEDHSDDSDELHVYRMKRWYDTSSTEVVVPSEDVPDSPTFHDSIADEGTRQEGSLTEMYSEFIVKTAAYEWLMKSLRRETGLIRADPDRMDEIAAAIMQALPPITEIDRHKSSDEFHVIFELLWDPINYYVEQEYEELPEEALQRAVTLTGDKDNAQAITAHEYLCQIWPVTGPFVMQLICKFVKQGTDRNASGRLSSWLLVKTRILI